jgi:hypothetical protein
MACRGTALLKNNAELHIEITLKLLQLRNHLLDQYFAYGSEAWTIRKADERRLTTAEVRFMRRTAGCSLLEHRRNEDILQELNTDPIVCYTQQY